MSNGAPEANAVRAAEREAILRLAREVAGRAARAAGYKDAAEVSETFVAMVLTEAFAARDAELQRGGEYPSPPDSLPGEQR
jgi:hypothetical protein